MTEALVGMLPSLVERAGAATVAGWLAPRALATCMLGDTRFCAAALELARDDAGAPIAAFPELAALAHPAPPQVEHDLGTDRPLLDHAGRVLARLAALEHGDAARWRPLSSRAFDELAAHVRAIASAGLLPALRAAILHLDIAKTTSAALRARWAGLGLALDVHNEAAAAIVRATDRAREWNLAPALDKLAVAWIEAHGLAGQHVRGEGPIVMFAPLVAALRELAPALGRLVQHPPHEATRLALDALHVLDACDTAAVRDGLVDDALLGKLARVRDQLVVVTAQAAFADPYAALAALAPPPTRAALADRLRALRAGRQRAGEPAAAIDDVVGALGDQEITALAPALATCQLWYCEAALSALSPRAHLAVLAAAIGAARARGIDVARPWHAQLRPLVGRLAGYRARLVEAALARVTMRELLAGGVDLGPLGAISGKLVASRDAMVIDYVDSAESAALVTLLGVYETRSSAAFHAMLKSLCDLYGLRKDEFDRVSNEASYLASMNAAKTDKARLLELVRPGRIVEVGPGGGVVLDLLAARFDTSEIVGVDASREAIAALEARAKASGARWRVVHGTADALPVAAGTIDTVVFCSILHEVYSYGEPRFSLASVERAVRAAWTALAPGGRIVIRDGVQPPPATRRLRFVAADARATFELYVAQFEGRKIELRELADGRVELSAADAMEFLYTYTWGPASFPYEVRELYGILPYDDYVAQLVAWCPGARVVPLPAEMRSYLQPGYREHLVGKIELCDEHDVAAALPDSNCLIAIEKPA
jgi:SAM-dependent methyltransferase